MTTASFSLAYAGDAIDVLASGSQTVTEGTAAPGAGDLEVRINVSAGWTKSQIERALDTIWRYLSNAENSQSIPL